MAHLCCLFYMPYVVGLRNSATKIVRTPWSGSTLLLAGYELLRRPPRALDSSAEVSGSSCCGCWQSVLALFVPQVSPSLKTSGRQGVAVWEQRERSAFSENAVERPLVPLQSYRVRREERFSTEVPTNPSWERCNDCMSTALTKGANRLQRPCWSQGDAPAVEAECDHSTPEAPHTPSTLSEETQWEGGWTWCREDWHISHHVGTCADLLPLNFGLREIHWNTSVYH